jgi:hypothetical protein
MHIALEQWFVPEQYLWRLKKKVTDTLIRNRIICEYK